MPDENMPLQKFKPHFKYNQNNKIQILIIVCYWVRPIWIDIQTSDGISVANKEIWS